jgi:hypothetical protein
LHPLPPPTLRSTSFSWLQNPRKRRTIIPAFDSSSISSSKRARVANEACECKLCTGHALKLGPSAKW